MANFVVTTALICDEIRQEINNKLIILGVYTGDLLVTELPATLLLTMYLEAKGLSAGDHQLEIRMTGPGDQQVGVQGPVTVAETGTIALPTPRLPLQIPESGLIIVEIKVDNGAWRKVVEKRVGLQPS